MPLSNNVNNRENKMPDNSIVQVSHHHAIARITLNRPAARNALSQEMLSQLNSAIVQVNQISSVCAVILDANGPGFCAGHDLKEMTAHRDDEDGGKAYYDKLFADCSKMMLAIVQSPKIFIAKVDGIATAAGCQLVGACDMAIASSEARFGVNGISSGLFCSTPMVSLSRNVGRKKAMELLTTGALMSALDAVSAELLNRVVEPADLEASVVETAQAVASKPASVLALGKKAFYAQLEMPLEEAYQYTSKVISDNVMMDEAKEGICAFIEKRKPNWDQS